AFQRVEKAVYCLLGHRPEIFGGEYGSHPGIERERRHTAKSLRHARATQIERPLLPEFLVKSGIGERLFVKAPIQRPRDDARQQYRNQQQWKDKQDIDKTATPNAHVRFPLL